MIINDKYLNSKPVYEIPEGVQIGEYRRGGAVVNEILPSFTPDVCIRCVGTPSIVDYKTVCNHWCIKSDNVKLLAYLRGYDWGSLTVSGCGVGGLPMIELVKIINNYLENKRCIHNRSFLNKSMVVGFDKYSDIVDIDVYANSGPRTKGKTPDFEPSVCFSRLRKYKEVEPKSRGMEIWFRTEDAGLLKYVRSNAHKLWNKGGKGLSVLHLKLLVIEYYEGVSNDNK